MAHVDEKALQRACQALNGRISSQDWPGATREVIETYLDAAQTSNAPDDVIDRACVAYWGEQTFNRIFGEKSRKGIREAMRRAAAALSTGAVPAWWIVKTDMGKVIFHGSDKPRADRVASMHHRTAEPLYAEPVQTSPGLAVKALQDIASHPADDIRGIAAKTLSALPTQVQDVAESGYSLDQIKAAYIAGYAQGNCLSGTLEGDEEWEEYFSCVVDTASPASKQGEAE